MLMYDLLATLWEKASTDLEIAHAVEVRTGSLVSRNVIDQHLTLLRTTGHIKAKNVGGLPAYHLTESGSRLLATYAEGFQNVPL